MAAVARAACDVACAAPALAVAPATLDCAPVALAASAWASFCDWASAARAEESAAVNDVGSSFARTWPLCTRALKSTSISLMMPDACEPMAIVFWGLTVPVAVRLHQILARQRNGRVRDRGRATRAHQDHAGGNYCDQRDQGGDRSPRPQPQKGYPGNREAR